MPNIKPICLRCTAVCHRSPAAVEPGSMSLGGGEYSLYELQYRYGWRDGYGFQTVLVRTRVRIVRSGLGLGMVFRKKKVS